MLQCPPLLLGLPCHYRIRVLGLALPVRMCVYVRVHAYLPAYDLSKPVCIAAIFLTQSEHAEKTNVAAIFSPPMFVSVIPGAFDLDHK